MSAVISKCGRYRYRLEREVGERSSRSVLFVMLNPSTADAEIDDPTIRRCASFVRSWGYGRLVVVNLFAFRATDPRALRTAKDPVGPRNDSFVVGEARKAARIVAAWGTGGKYLDRDRVAMGLLADGGVECLGTTDEGFPRHPLYLGRDVLPRPYSGR